MRSYFLNLAIFLVFTVVLNFALVTGSFGFRDRDWDFRKITITSPEGGEKFIAGSKQKISWQTSSSIRYVKIEYSINDGKEWKELVKNMKMDEPFASYDWEVPCAPTSEAKIRLSDVYGPDYDVLIKAFSIICDSESNKEEENPSGKECKLYIAHTPRKVTLSEKIKGKYEP